ncbi:Malonyl CoA-acyl carrier protein transacylase (modular protein) [Gammaproteobacteria bacterium]
MTELGIRFGDCVALCLPNHPSFISSYLGIQKLGAVAVSVNTTLKPAEIDFILQDAQIKVLITTESLNPSKFTLPPGCHLLFIENIEKRNLSKKHYFTAVERDAKDLAVILYTSGTTGFPKGAMLSQENLISNIRTCVELFGYTEDDRILLFLPLFHSFGQYAALNSCLEAGATLILHREFENGAIVRSIAEHQVTTFFGVPTIYNLLLDHAAAAEMSSIRRYISAAAPLPLEIAQRWKQKIGVPVSQGYGLTECSLVCFNPSPLQKPDSVGLPLEGIEVKIVDDQGQKVGTGELGEIIIRGHNVMSGYWQRPEETAQVLKEGWFHTGDIGQLDADGYLYIVDRLKDMINVGGYKVYPSEIENRIYQHPAIADAAVYGVPEPLMGEQVHAELVLKAGETATAEEIIDFCRPVLAEYKLPSVIKFADFLPKSKTGKILKRILRDQSQTAVFDDASPARSSDEIKDWLQNWLNQTLIHNARPIALDKPFFDYGLKSILAVTMVRQLGQWMGKPLSPAIVWNYPTINALATHLSKRVESSVNSLKKSNFSGELEPVAIIGMGCRFPGGADTPEKFWELLRKGTDTTADIPSSRWDIDRYYDANRDKPGKTYVRTGSFLEEVDKFDARFFGIPPLEAESTDPQQRILLEVGWEAIENAGIAPADLKQTSTGVFIGSFWDDYSGGHLYQDAAETLDAYRMLSSLRGLIAGRLAYILDLQGPVMQLDAACSSSLLAVHLACQSLSLRECHLALAGGVAIFLSPANLIGLSSLRAISSDGRCKSFAAQADGFGIGEGAGIVILKRLSDALAEGDKILAVIKGSAVNHDGRSNGLTAPNGLAQGAVLRQALQNARIFPEQIDYIEAHGTGTELGDLIELNALGQVFAPNRSRPLMIGSVKSNIGHLSAAAGIASLIKVVLSLQHGLIPPNLHIDEPNPHIPWTELNFMVPTTLIPWTNKTRLAGITSFGMTGTNVHVIIEEAPASESFNLSVPERPVHLCTLSGKTEKALTDQVVNYINHLTDHSELKLSDICHTANTGRVHFEHRLAVAAETTADLQQKLRAFRQGNAVRGLVQGQSASAPIAFLFTGQGSQYADMGRELYETHPVFRAVIDQCQEILRPYLEIPLLEVLYGKDKEANERRLIETQYTQTALFAIEYALARLWQSWGVVPNFVMGHSVGEYAAACVAGVFSMEDGLKLVAERVRLMQQLPSAGMMVAVQLDEAGLTKLIQPYLNEITIATFNAPQSLVLSGQTGSMEVLIRQLTDQGIRCRRLSVSYAFHSSLMTPMLAEFERIAQRLTYKPPQLKLVSNLTGGLITAMGAEYWVQQICQPVRFAQGMKTLTELGVEVFIEVGPQPTLLGLGQQCLAEWNSEKLNLAANRADNLWLPSLYPKQQSDWKQLSESLAILYVHGMPVNWQGFDAYYKRQKVDLPTYPFQRQRYWINRKFAAHKPSVAEYPLQGQKIILAHSPEIVFQSNLSIDSPAYLTDHRVSDKPIFPAAAYLEMVLNAGQELFRGKSFFIQNVAFQRPMLLSERETTVQLLCVPIPNGYRWQVFSLAEASQEWRLHSAGDMAEVRSERLFLEKNLVSLQAQCPAELSIQAHYQHLAEQGLVYGPAFRGLEQIFQGKGEALGRIRLPKTLLSETENYQLHPALLDACFRVSVAAIEPISDEPLLPFGIETFQLFDAGGHQTVWSYAKIREKETASATGVRTVDLTLLSDSGQVVAEAVGLTLSPANLQTLSENTLRTDWIYQLRWHPSSLPTQQPLAHIAPEERYARLKQHILNEIQTVVGTAPTDTKNFFSLGMDSLQSIQLGSRLAASFGISLPATLAMKYPTLAELTDYLAKILFAPLSQNQPILHVEKYSEAGPEEATYPQLYNQQECYLRHEQTANKACNHICMTMRVVSPVDKIALKNTLQTLTDRHDVLRTIYFKHGANLMQRILPSQTVDFEMIEVDCQSWEESSSLIQEAARKPFDLKCGPVLRCCLFSKGIADHLFLMVVHHIVADATAFAILLKEFWTLYQSHQCPPEMVLPPVTFSFSNYVRWQTAMLESEEGERLWHYWQQQLANDLPRLNLPTDYDRPPKASHYGVCYPFQIDGPLTQQLRTVAQNEGGTLYMLLLTAFKILLRQYSGQDEILVAAHTLNRTQPEFVNVVGYLADTVILRTRIPESIDFSNLFQQVRSTVLAAMDHQGYPMKLLAERLPLSLNSLYSVWFTMIPQQIFEDAGVLLFNQGELMSDGLNVESANNIIPPWQGVWYDLELNLIEGTDAISGTLAYCTDLFKEPTIAGMVVNFQNLLKKIASDPEKI